MRIREALLELVTERGYEAVTVTEVVERAGVERDDFEGLFAGKDELCVAVFEEIALTVEEHVVGTFEAHESWREGLRACAYAMVRYMRDNPREVSFGAVHILAAGELAQVYRERQLQRWVDLIDLGRQELDEPDSIGRGVAEGVLGSIHSRLIKELQDGRGTGSLEGFVPDMMYIAVRPYLGHEAAREELTVPPPPEADEARPASPVDAAREGGEGPSARPLTRLPRGRHGLSRQFVVQNQRDRLAAATIEVVAEHGFNAATIAQICLAASVSRRTFYAIFSSKEECFFAAYGAVVEHLLVETDAAAAKQAEWPAKVAAKLRVSLEFLAANPDLAMFCLAAPQWAGEEVAARYRAAMGGAVAYLCEGMPAPPATKPRSEAVTASLMGGMISLVVRKVNGGAGDSLPELLPDLLELFLTPYLGRASAQEAVRACGTGR